MGEQADAAGQLVERAAYTVIAASDDRLDLALDTGASMLAASPERWPDVSRALLAFAEKTIATTWTAAWRPADLVRIVGRELGAVHLALAVDFIAAENRRHPAATLDRRWQEQLRDLDVNPWWPSDEEYLAGFAVRHKLDRFALATAALEVLRAWTYLPSITPVGPIPGQSPQQAHNRNVPLAGESRMLSRIRGLLAKAESTDFPDEAEALTAKAQELMARHSIDEALLSLGRPSADTPGALRIGVDTPYDGPKTMLLDAVADANRCRAVWSKEFGFCTVVGFDADLDAVELLYTSLLVQATAAMHHASDKRHRGGSPRTRAFRQSFLVAYAGRIRERLTAATEQATREATEERHTSEDGTALPDDRLLPVLAAREEAVDETIAEMFPKLTSQRVRISDGDGYAAGQAAADQAALGGKKKESVRGR